MYDHYLAELTFENIGAPLHHLLPWQRYSWSYFVKTTSAALCPTSYALRSYLPDTFPADGYYGSINTTRGLLNCSSLVESWARVSEYLGSEPILTRLTDDGPDEIKKLLEDSYAGPLNLFAEMTGILNRAMGVEDFLFTYCAVCYLSLDPPLPPLFVPPNPDSPLAMHIYPVWRFWLLCHFFSGRDCISCDLENEELVALISEIRRDCFAETARDGSGLQPMAGLSEKEVVKIITAEGDSSFLLHFPFIKLGCGVNSQR